MDLCSDRVSPQGRDGGTVFPPVVLDSFSQLWSIHRRSLMNRLVCDDRFSIICSYFIRTSYILTIQQYRAFSKFSNVTLAHCINPTNATHWCHFEKGNWFKTWSCAGRIYAMGKDDIEKLTYYWPTPGREVTLKDMSQIDQAKLNMIKRKSYT